VIASALLERLRSLEVRLWLEGDVLRYSAPKGALTPELLAEMRLDKPGLIEILRMEPCPPGFAQERLWFLDQLEPGGSRYNVPIALRLEGQLDFVALTGAFARLVERHEALRTRFVAAQEGRPEAIVDQPAPPPLPLTDCSHLSMPKAEAEAARLAEEEARRPFLLDSGPLLRLRLIRLASEAHVLLICIHHIAVDGWSVGIVLNELSSLYEAEHSGQACSLPAPPQPASLARSQQAWLSSASCLEEEAWWAARLAGAPAEHRIPLDKPRKPVPSGRGGYVAMALPEDLGARIAALARQEGATSFMVLLAATFALLHRWSGDEDLCLGCPVAGRDRPELHGMVGFLVNTLVLRETVIPTESFRALLGRVRRSAIEALSHQNLPFDRVVDVAGAQRRPGVNPLFQVMLAYENTPKPRLRMGEMKVRRFAFPYAESKFDLTFDFEEVEGVLEARIEYETDLFEPASAARFGAQLSRLLAAVARDPALLVGSIELASDEERRMLLAAGTGPRLAVAPATFPEAFEARVGAAPDALAIVAADGSLTYAALAARAERFARTLTARGVRPGDLVGLCVERSVAAVVAMLAIWRAGAAWVPVDPLAPVARLNSLLQDAAPRHVVTLRDDAPRLAEIAARCGATLICIDAPDPAPGTLPDGPPPAAPAAEDIAYVIYTSGSTGEPKGVVVTHRNLANLCVAVTLRDGLVAADRVLQFSSTQFDVAVEEIAPTLWVGAALTPWAGGEYRLDPAEFTAFVSRHGLTVLNIPTAYWHVLIDTELPRCVRLCVVGGEAPSPDSLHRWRRRNRHTAWVNAYGPTEATVTATALVLQPGTTLALARARVPIGKPLANVTALVLDDARRPVAPGVPGDLFIGGAGVALGYWRRPSLTVDRFIESPFSADPEDRLYRTGDRARWNADGELEFLGRRDHQVKLRGFRIELAEVENALLVHPAVTEAIVELRRPVDSGASAGTEGELLAWYTGAIQPAALREHLLARLPGYMIPARIEPLAEMPRTAGGKIDRGALARRAVLSPEPVSGGQVLSGLEARIVPVWAEVLGRRSVGGDEDFFALGGHSLLAVQLAHRLRGLLRRPVPTALLLKHPTPRSLAAALQAAGPLDSPARYLDALQPLGNRSPIVLAPGGDGNSIIFLELATALGPDQPLFAFHTPGLEGDGSPIHNLAELAACFCQELRHAGLRAEDLWIGGWSMGGVVALEIARQLHSAGTPPRGLMVFDSFLADDISEIGKAAETAGFDVSPPGVLASNDDALMSYMPRFALDLHLHYLEAEQDLLPIPRVAVRRRWQTLMRRPVRLWQVPGDHFSMLRPPHAMVLAEVIRAAMDGTGDPASWARTERLPAWDTVSEAGSSRG
jgi:amino acid adenylation domain-containing protein